MLVSLSELEICKTRININQTGIEKKIVGTDDIKTSEGKSTNLAEQNCLNWYYENFSLHNLG